MSLKDIQQIITDSDFDLIEALESHKSALKSRAKRLKNLLNTIDKTINKLKNKNVMLTEDEIYEGFSREEVNARRKEVSERWGEDQLLKTEDRIRKMGKEGWHDLKQKEEEINQLLADLMDLPPEHAKVQAAIQLHYRHLNDFYEVSKERYLGLGNMYTTDERFTAYYEKYRTGLTQFINEAIQVFCESLK